MLVYTPAKVAEWRQVPQAFVTAALREGTTLMNDPAEVCRGLLRRPRQDRMALDTLLPA